MSEFKQPEPKRSKGGSRMYEYSGGEFDKPQIGFSDESHAAFQEQREKLYESLFGEADSVYHEVLPLVPHVDVYVYKPTSDRDFYTLITGGMSDLRMTLPRGVSSEYARAELVFYCKEPEKSFQETLRRLAHFPHDNKTWLSYGHTMPNGNPPTPVFGSALLTTFLFMPSIVAPESDLEKNLVLDGDPVNLLWVVPLTTAECEYKLENGVNGIYDLFDEHKHPVAFDHRRNSYV